MSGYIYLTKEGLENLKTELQDLRTRGRREAAAAIAEAREKGDLSENAEYDAAKDAQGMLEKKIAELEETFAHARLVDESNVDTSKVMILSRVKIQNVQNNKELTYTIVSEAEADLKQHKISIGSPIGKGLLGHKVGDIAEIKTPRATLKFKILDIQR